MLRFHGINDLSFCIIYIQYSKPCYKNTNDLVDMYISLTNIFCKSSLITCRFIILQMSLLNDISLPDETSVM